MPDSWGFFLGALALLALARAECWSNSTSQADMQAALRTYGLGYVLSLCAGQTYTLTEPLRFTAANQEISTEGYPTDDGRATLLIGGNSTCAIQGNGPDLNGIRLRNIQIDGNREGNRPAPTPNDGGNIEIGGNNRDQLVEFVRSFNPRGWTCLHVMEGELKCLNSTIQHNDIGPCGHDTWADWADGISLSCANSTVFNNSITDATDGAIVIFGAPYSTVQANHIRVKTRTMMGGINLVDMHPWTPDGNYSGTRVLDNRIEGGYATSLGNDQFGPQNESALIKIGIAVGPRVWWARDVFQNTSRGGEVSGNVLSGAFSFGVAVASVKDFVVTNNSFVGNASFIGNYGANCSQWDQTPNSPVPLLKEPETTTNAQIGKGEVNGPGTDWDWVDGRVNGLTCFTPPDAGSWMWPYGGGGVNAAATGTGGANPTESSPSGTGEKSGATRAKGGIWGVAVAVGAACFVVL